MKARACFDEMDSQGYNFFIIMKKISETQFKPVYKSEIKPVLNNEYEWNTLLLQTTDVTNG